MTYIFHPTRTHTFGSLRILGTVIVKQLASMRDRKNIYDFGYVTVIFWGAKEGGFGRLSATSGIQNPELQTDNYSMRHLNTESMEFY